ncbi:hypothetical protein GCM10009676_07740 [Prauserella halophila]|uniref:Cytochrome P450 n=1 Tax=Prauserella halophila TaxID=185641 RepID=A0ABP4GLL7_9PSEU|nr:cytochrome P450 [Prauserella halophila]MCP2237174.1 Cytochrome P450 [Prauserella halophila]
MTTTGSTASAAPDTGVHLDDVTATAPPPGPRLPRIVQTLLYGSYREHWMPRLRRRHGDVFRLRVFPDGDVVQLANVEHIRAVFGGPADVFHAGEGNVILKPAMGRHSVLLTDEDVHLRARKLLMPAFNGAALRGYRDLITELAGAEVDGWRPGPVRSHERMQAVTLESILRVVFGVAEGPRLDRLRELLRRIVDIGPVDLLGWHQPKLQRFGVWKRDAEVRAAADDHDEKHLEAVVKEAMRLHPVISEVARVVTRDVEIGGHRIPAGHGVMPSITMVQHDPAHHDDPHAFRPERFTGSGPATGTWFPFGGGVRRCLGAGFSLLESAVVLGEVLRRFRITPDRTRPERAKARNITMVPARGARLVITPR